MKRQNRLFSRVIDPDNLRAAWAKAVREKAGTPEAREFECNLEYNLIDIACALKNGNYAPGPYRQFVIKDPKERIISAAPFVDRVAQHAIMAVLDPIFESYQIYDSYACRVGKGTRKAVLRAFGFAKAAPYFLKLDVRKYFNSIDHFTLKQLLLRRIRDKDVIRVLFAIIDSYETSPGRGIPIGNLTSQYFANHYLALFDHYAKEKMGCRRYLRYMDDILIFGTEKAALRDIYDSAESFLGTMLELELRPPVLDATRRGAPFLGFLVKPTGIFLSAKTRNRFRSRFLRIDHELRWGVITDADAGDRVLSMVAHISIARSLKFRNTVFRARPWA